MSLGAHFRELRNRLTISVLAVLVGAVVGWIFYDPVIDFISAPVEAVRDSEGDRIVSLNFAGVTDAFAMQVKVALFVGIALASPVWIWQIWAFLLPGLTRPEKRIALSYFFVSIPLFFAGASLAGFTFPRLYAILLEFAPDGFSNIQNASAYLTLVLYFCLAFGLAFLLPVVLIALNQIGILPAPLMLKGWRLTLFGILVFSAFMTPDPSAVSMLLMAAPVFALYWCAVAFAFALDRRRAKKDPDRYAGLSPDEATPLS
ncbi:Twin-arginine translocation protein TatC [Serinicoccus hydrothermalis]|uniref:Sec-independent protein translocase protein TatC n=2 Tax=Serinicoccus hydrothermalis TaxID=1758689 RepID=A0A1B1N8I8_9MICO|nr:Twin-arginine translocation protein TatC [Serinicoccus hydrothermalis]